MQALSLERMGRTESSVGNAMAGTLIVDYRYVHVVVHDIHTFRMEILIAGPTTFEPTPLAIQAYCFITHHSESPLASQ